MLKKLFRLGLNLGLRGGSLLAKFGLMIYVTRYIGLEAVGILGLLQAANVIGTKVIGFGLYFVANREIVDIAAEKQARIIRDQYLVYLFVYGAVIILTLSVWPWVPAEWQSYTLYSVALLIAAHQVLELGNTLIALHRSLATNIIFAVTNGLWAVPPIILGVLDPAYRTLDAVLQSWLWGAVLSWLCGWLFVRDLPLLQACRNPANWAWTKIALRRGMPMFIAIITMNGSMYVDRYVITWLTSLELAGVFVMFWSFAYAVQVLMQTGVLVTEYPKLIADYKKQDEATFWRRFKALSWRMALGGGLACLLAGVVIQPIVQFVNKPLALEYIELFYLMLLAFWIKFQADVSNYALYARHQDKALSLSYFCNLVVTSLSNVTCVWLWGLAGAGIAQIITAVALTGFQGWLLWRKRHERISHAADDDAAPAVG